MKRFSLRSSAARRRSRREWQHVGLVAGFLSGRHFVGTKDLHYGYWQDGVTPNIFNMPAAQEAYSNFLLQHIPADAKRILDVGSGAGSVAHALVARGHEVDCVSPCRFLNDQARRLLGDKVRLFDCRYEDFDCSGLYDVILFCESFQYMDLAIALDRVSQQLHSGGKLVICDFFRKDVEGHSPIRGGYRLQEFWDAVSSFPLRLVRDIDITSRTAPTFTVIEQAFSEVLHPVWSELLAALDRAHPIWATCAKWLFRHRIEKFEKKYLGRARTAEMFGKFKSYRLMVLERALRTTLLTDCVSGHSNLSAA